ncbi:MAG: hypothetical protein IJ681_03085 [Bacteroidales bacterium]|nr:hypothetical protein [Bacteroidales bacterium]
MRPKLKKTLFVFTVVFVFFDVIYSFRQHYNAVLDGDIPESVLPLPYIESVFADPLGIKTIINNNPHAAPNRFFSHYFENRWFNSVPFAFQLISDPIHSVYLSQGLFKTIIQVLLIYLLTVFTFGTFLPFNKWKHWLVILFYSALFQSCGKVRSMGIIDPAVTYVFFYAMPLLFLMLYLLPFIFEEFYSKKAFKSKIFTFIWSIVFLLLSNFSGPVNTGTALVFIAVIFLRYIRLYTKRAKRKPYILNFFKYIPKHFWLYLLPLGVVALYSLFLGTYNTMWTEEAIPLKVRFLLLPRGIFEMFVHNFGFSILTTGCLINTVLLLRTKNKNYENAASLFAWILLFTCIYILLLPLGGYRHYRPYIIRYDTVICISVAFFFYEVYSSLILLSEVLKNKTQRGIYITYIIIFAGYFFVIDDPASWRKTEEKEMMYKIAESKDNPVILDRNVTVIAWEPANEPQKSVNSAKCMKLWNITKDEKLFYCNTN